jgi:hypothetical protein
LFLQDNLLAGQGTSLYSGLPQPSILELDVSNDNANTLKNAGGGKAKTEYASAVVTLAALFGFVFLILGIFCICNACNKKEGNLCTPVDDETAGE